MISYSDYSYRERFALAIAKRDFRKKDLIECWDEPFENGVGHHWIYRFQNGFGASVIFSPYSYGTYKMLYELAVLKFHGEDNYR